MKLANLKQYILITFFFLLSLGSLEKVKAEIITDGQVLIEYEKPNEAFAQRLATISPQAISEVNQKLQTNYQKQIHMVVAPDKKIFNKLTGVDPEQAQAGAIARHQLIVFNIANLSGYDQDSNFKLLKHEVTHLVLGELAGFDTSKLPRWFNEGIAQWVSEGYHELYSPAYTNSLEKAFLAEKVIDFSSLEKNFPTNASDFVQAYAQSLSLIQFIDQNYGKTYLQATIRNLSSNLSFQENIQQVTGIRWEKILNDWQSQGRSTYDWTFFLASNVNNFLWMLLVFAGIAAYLRLRQRKAHQKKLMIKLEEEQV